MKILVVDDDELRRSRLVNYIEGQKLQGIEIITVAGNVDEAKAFLKRVYYDILILDVVLPRRHKSDASAENGLALLGQISRSTIMKKPGKIIGITAYEEDIKRYREEFENNCAVVIEAKSNQSEWRAKIVAQLTYSISSRISRTAQDFSATVLTIHGIQTFGDWQDRLKALTESHTDSVDFNTYKYGYFSAVSFLIPFARYREVAKLRDSLRSLLVSSESKHVVIFCHSFGTYLAAYTMKYLLDEISRFEKVTLVLSGSVLQSDYDWAYLKKYDNVTIVSECGDRDFVLWISRALVLGVGMAGKVGFHGFNNLRFTNRFFKGGHSLYFKGNDFMSKYWLPIIINEDYKPKVVDERKPGFIMHGLADKIINIIGKAKPLLYVFLLYKGLFFILK
ncbi:response regulator [Pseudomonas monteilii]|uniref:LytR/AlgR family response regulator transcription factor n=1 Tax=Pseudomonas monteilii TaxID=76759 RepID=UPI0018D726B1|nr:response regulator [Pseudomonas monteilii]MBH3454190.1 response regulator [Pseudomonas monteilii]